MVYFSIGASTLLVLYVELDYSPKTLFCLQQTKKFIYYILMFLPFPECIYITTFKKEGKVEAFVSF